MPSSVDEQPPDHSERPRPEGARPERPRPQPPRRRPPARSRAAASRSTASRTAADTRRRRPPPPPPRRRRPVEDDDAAAGPEPRPARSQTKTVVLLSVATVVVIGLIALAVSLTSEKADPGPAAAPDDTPVPMATFRDPETGISVEYPRAWKRVEVPVAEYRLAVDGGNNVAFTIRVVPIQTPATAQNLQNFKAVTDGLVASNSTVKVLKEQAIQLNGMLGYYYFYTFTDRDVEAVHAHYFLFSGHKMNVIVFQTLPDDFERMAVTFDKIAESFRSDPNVPSGPPPSTSAPAPTTTSAP